jgi:glycosyltransferase involved in cell wall biosynthesis
MSSSATLPADATGSRDPVQASRPMRVCMVSFYCHPDYSGSSIQALNLSRHLTRRGVSPFIVSANLSGSPAAGEEGGITIHRVPVARRRDWQITTFWATLSAFLVRHRHDYDIVHAHGTMQHGTASLCARALGKPSILKIAMAGSDIAFHRQGRLWGRVNRAMVSRFDRYIATTDVIAQEFADQKLDTSRVRHIPNGVDTDTYAPLPIEARRTLRRSLGLPDSPIVSFVGIINGRKNVDGILRIWRQSIAGGAPGHLVLVGPSPDDPAGLQFVTRVKKFVRSEGLDSRVTFAGYTADVVSYLQASDAFLFPSRQEGMANVVLEAMACGVPCLVSGAAGAHQVVRDGVDGYARPVDDEGGFADALAGLLQDDMRRSEFSARARAGILERFALPVIADKYVSLYEELLADGR